MTQTPIETASLAQIKQPWWLSLLPTFIRKEIENRIELIGASDSFFWLSLDTGTALGLSFIINILLARSLGPTQFGYFSYLFAFFSVFSPISKLGLPNIVVRNLSRKPKDRDQILGTSFSLRFLAGLLTMILATLAMFIIRPQDQFSQLLISFLGIMALVQSLEVVEYYFQSKLYLKRLTLYKIIAVAIAIVLKVIAIVFSLPFAIILFLWTIEAIFIAIAYIFSYIQSASFLKWRFNFSIAKKLVRQGLPLMFSSVVVMGYAQADQLFLNFFEGPAKLGQYSVTITILSGLTILPMIVQKAVAPVLMKTNQKKQANLFNYQLQQLYRLMTIISFVVGTVLVIFGPLTVKLLYGEAYSEAGHLLALLPFRFFFISFGVIRSLFVVSHGLFDYDLITNIVAVIVSITGSIVFIPMFGIYGLLLASFFSLLTSVFIMDLFHSQLRKNALLALEAIITPHKFKLS